MVRMRLVMGRVGGISPRKADLVACTRIPGTIVTARRMMTRRTLRKASRRLSPGASRSRRGKAVCTGLCHRKGMTRNP